MTNMPRSIADLELSDPIERIGLQNLYAILGRRRAAGSIGEADIIRRFIAPITVKDTYGNYHKHISKPDGTDSQVMWSCHTDTVHRNKLIMNQQLRLSVAGVISLEPKEQVRECLGADDGSGLWLMLEMIANSVPGWYIFHREEETGRQGSEWFATKHDAMIKASGIKYSIAFDRRGFDSVITHQSSQRTCSDAFARSMISAMGPKLKYKIDTGGSYTDTYSYAGLISECTNLSVGYTGAHGVNEDQDLKHLLLMRDKLVRFDESVLVAERDQTKKESLYSNTYSSYNYYGGSYRGISVPTKFATMGENYHGRSRYMTSPPMGSTEEEIEVYELGRIADAWHLEVGEILRDFGYNGDSLWEEIQERRLKYDLEVEARKEAARKETEANVVHIGKKNELQGLSSLPGFLKGVVTNPPTSAGSPLPDIIKGTVAIDKDNIVTDAIAAAQDAEDTLVEQIEAARKRMRLPAGADTMVSSTGVYTSEELELLLPEQVL